jgi:hypothetical protein
MTRVALGFRAKTGRAIAVVLSEDDRAPAFEWRGEISLVDPRVPETAQPYHEVMEMPWAESMRAVAPFVAAIEAAAARALDTLREDLRSRDLIVRAVGIVGSADRDLAKIGNPHIRAHAAEGILFRRVLEAAAAKAHLPSRAFTEATLIASAASELHISPRAVQSHLKALGRSAGPPWRAEQRAAATAAWVAQVKPQRR